MQKNSKRKTKEDQSSGKRKELSTVGKIGHVPCGYCTYWPVVMSSELSLKVRKLYILPVVHACDLPCTTHKHM